jgi:dipeptidyl aminopeptidase/acylaminoacyl peptidase
MVFESHQLVLWLSIVSAFMLYSPRDSRAMEEARKSKYGVETQITDRASGHILTNINVWSPDGQWIVYDTRSDAAGEKFDGSTIEIVNVETGDVREIFRSRNGSHCGVATFSPKDNRVVFIHGPENPTSDWQYGPYHRQGVVVDIDRPHEATPLDARDLTPPYTAGALRGGSHVHIFDDEGAWVSYTYEDHVLATLDATPNTLPHETNQRNIGVSVPGRPVRPAGDHPRNHDGSTFSVLVTRTVDNPRPGSDEISRAFEEGWIGTHGYTRRDGTRQRHALAFQGKVVAPNGEAIAEVFVVDIPEDVTRQGDLPLAGTETTRPAPPRGVVQRRLTFTHDRKHPGIQGPRHWLRTSPDGERIAFLMRDQDGVVQIWTVSPNGGQPRQLTHNSFDVASTFSWSPDGGSIAYIADGSVFVSNAKSGDATRLTPKTDSASSPRPEACVFSPDGNRIAYVRPVTHNGATYNQIFVVTR